MVLNMRVLRFNDIDAVAPSSNLFTSLSWGEYCEKFAEWMRSNRNAVAVVVRRTMPNGNIQCSVRVEVMKCTSIRIVQAAGISSVALVPTKS